MGRLMRERWWLRAARGPRARPRARWPAAAVACATAAALAACGGQTDPRAVGLREVPLPPHTTIAAHARTCDHGANAYCSIQLVVTGPAYGTSATLLIAERRLLAARHWSAAQGQIRDQSAADSPGSELRLMYASAFVDLSAVDLGWIRRAAPISHALSDVLFARAPSLSMLVVRGSS
ncbi:MAG: hypothetical protein ACRDMX_12325 [Solirubrobacteraceae bacterium]